MFAVASVYAGLSRSCNGPEQAKDLLLFMADYIENQEWATRVAEGFFHQ